MWKSWWWLPGPSSFLDLIEDDLRCGCNIIIVSPRISPSGLESAICDRIIKSDARSLHSVRIGKDAKSADPVEYLHDLFSIQLARGISPSAGTLVESELFQDRILWIDGVTSSEWNRWERFLMLYQRSCQVVPEHKRALICLQLIGPNIPKLPNEDVGLKIRKWTGVTDRLDMQMFVACKFRNSTLPHFQRHLAVSVITELAGTDPHLGQFLIDSELVQILEPVDLLAQYWSVRTNDSIDAAVKPSWEHGTLDRLEGKLQAHSSYLAASKQYSEIDSRVWRGQIGVLMPLLEEARSRVIQRFGLQLKPHLRKLDRPIDKLGQLEIGQILFLARKARLPIKEIRAIEQLANMRNCLAHLRPISADLICSTDWQKFLP